MAEFPTDLSHSALSPADDDTARAAGGRARLPIAAAITLLVTSLSIVWLATHIMFESQQTRAIGGALALLAPSLLASWLALGVTRRRDLSARDRRGWICLGLAAGAASVFGLTVCLDQVGTDVGAAPMIGAIAHAAMLALGTIGALHWVRKLSPSATVGTLLELACVAVLAYVVTWRSLLSAAILDTESTGWTVDTFTLYATPILATLVLVAVVTVISQIGKQELRGAELLAVFGMGSIVASDLGMALRGIGRGGLDGAWHDTVVGDAPGTAVLLGWILGLAAIGFGGALRRAAPTSGSVVPLVERSTTWELLVSILPFGLLGIVLATSTSKSGGTEVMTRSVLACLGALLLLRCTLVAITAIRAARTRQVDRLTNAHSHRQFREGLPRLVAEDVEAGRSVALISLDIDDFALLNDTAGHGEGDRWLREAAWTMRRELGTRDQLYRTGADQFAILLRGTSTAEASDIAERIAAALRQVRPANEIAPTCTMGIASIPDHASDADDLVRLATGTCYWGQLGGTGTITTYDPAVVKVLTDEERLRRFEHTARLRAVLGLARALDARDAYTARHSESVARYAVAIARELGWSAERIELLHMAGLVHDVGKIGVRDTTLRKSAKLDPDEWHEMRQHPELGARVIADVTPNEIIPWVLSHHERPDGTGYPHGLDGDSIPEGALILAVADTFDAMTSNRSYRNAMSPLKAIDIIVSEAGAQFDPTIVRAFLAALRHGSIDLAQVADRATRNPAQPLTDGVGDHGSIIDPEFLPEQAVVETAAPLADAA